MATAGANVSHGGNGVNNASTTQVAVLSCPVVDTSATPHTGVTALTVFAVDNSTTARISASACVQFTTVPGGTCGLNANSSVAGTGLVNLSPTRAAWTVGSDLPYLFVSLPPATPNMVPARLLEEKATSSRTGTTLGVAGGSKTNR